MSWRPVVGESEEAGLEPEELTTVLEWLGHQRGALRARLEGVEECLGLDRRQTAEHFQPCADFHHLLMRSLTTF